MNEGCGRKRGTETVKKDGEHKTRDEGQETRDEGQDTRDEGQKIRDERQERKDGEQKRKEVAQGKTGKKGVVQYRKRGKGDSEGGMKTVNKEWGTEKKGVRDRKKG